MLPECSIRYDSWLWPCDLFSSEKHMEFLLWHCPVDSKKEYGHIDHINSTFAEYQVVKGSGAVPDISVHVEKTDEASQRPLSPEAYTKFRKALGRLLWMAQTRMDLKVWLSLLGSQQANPVAATEAALRAVLRFLKSDSCVVLRFPTRSELVQHESGPLRVFLHMFCDASHAPNVGLHPMKHI